MKKVLKKILVNYGGVILFYLTVIIATISLISDYNMYSNEIDQSNLSTAEMIKL